MVLLVVGGFFCSAEEDSCLGKVSGLQVGMGPAQKTVQEETREPRSQREAASKRWSGNRNGTVCTEMSPES